ncbi:MAG TPA: hypothetical protein VH116_09535 [Gemmatimonadales bacterium]|jgi:hypothetical protein|nr:hypothetical protein [Gemmatimonadales bacterium]
MIPSLCCSLATVLRLAGAPLGAVAAPAVAVEPQDSAQRVEAARQAQRTFEVTRRFNLPQGAGSSSGRCDTRIGRFCYWPDEPGDSGPAEPARISQARDRLVAALDSAAALLPGDPWIAGQRVRYLLDARRPGPALAAAQHCRAAAWWCAALVGLALHSAADFAGADSSFARALRAMPPAERCRWTDISPLLDGAVRREYERSSCEARQALTDRWWWLATPLFSRRGNDRRSEHFARVAWAAILQDGANPFGLGWADDLRELLIRYGVPTRWSANRSASTPDDPGIVGHDREPGFQFGPSPHALAAPGNARPADWNLTALQAREQYAPPYAARFVTLPHQVAVFHHGDSAVVVAAYDPSPDTVFAARAIEAALVLAREDAPLVAARHDVVAHGRDVLVAAAPWGPLLVSLEVVAAPERSVGRVRCGLRWDDAGGKQRTGRVSLSDILLFDPPTMLPASLAGAGPLAYGSDRVPQAKRLGLFWEVYGLDPGGEAITATLALTAERRGWVRRVAESVGLVARRRAVQLRWVEVPSALAGVASRALALDLGGVTPGRYRIELTVAPGDQDPLTATRQIEVVER